MKPTIATVYTLVQGVDKKLDTHITDERGRSENIDARLRSIEIRLGPNGNGRVDAKNAVDNAVEKAVDSVIAKAENTVLARVGSAVAKKAFEIIIAAAVVGFGWSNLQNTSKIQQVTAIVSDAPEPKP